MTEPRDAVIEAIHKGHCVPWSAADCDFCAGAASRALDALDAADTQARPSQREARRIAAEVLGNWEDELGVEKDPDFDRLELAFSHALERAAADTQARGDSLVETWRSVETAPIDGTAFWWKADVDAPALQTRQFARCITGGWWRPYHSVALPEPAPREGG